MRHMKPIQLVVVALGMFFVHPVAFAVDSDGDGIDSSVDCDDGDSSVGSMLQQRDEDGDGYGKTVYATQVSVGGDANFGEMACYIEEDQVRCIGRELGGVSPDSIASPDFSNLALGQFAGCGLNFHSKDSCASVTSHTRLCRIIRERMTP